jgi:hypothetical protein
VVGGGAVEVHRATAPPEPAKARVAAPHVTSVSALQPVPIQHVADRLGTPSHAMPAEQVSRDTSAAAPAPADSVASDVQPASDSTVVDQSTGGLLAPDETTDTVNGATDDDAPAQTTDSGTGQVTSSDSAPTTTEHSGTTGAQSGPDGGPTGATAPTAQGATAPGSTQTPS